MVRHTHTHPFLETEAIFNNVLGCFCFSFKMSEIEKTFFKRAEDPGNPRTRHLLLEVTALLHAGRREQRCRGYGQWWKQRQESHPTISQLEFPSSLICGKWTGAIFTFS